MSYKLFAQRVGLVGIVNIIISLRGLILLPILTKTLGTELYGVWTQILVTISLLMPLGLLGLNTAMIRFFAGEKDKNKIKRDFYSVFTIVSLFSVLLALIILIFSEPLAVAFFGGSASIIFVKLLSLIIILTTLDLICIEFFRALQQMKKYSAFLILQEIPEILLISYAVLSGYSIFGALLSVIVVRAFLLLLGFLFISSQIGIEKPDLSVLKPYLLFSLPLVPAALLSWVVEISDRYVIAYLLDMSSVGIYSAAYNIGRVVSIFMAPIGIILLPTITDLYENNKIEELKMHLKYSLKFFLMLAIPSLFGLTVLSKSLLVTLTTSDFVSAYLIVPIVALGAVFYASTGISVDILAVLKRTKTILWATVGGASINLTLNIIFIPIIGILGAAISTLITFFFIALVLWTQSFKGIPFDIDVKFITKSIVASVPMAFVVWKLNPYGAVNILIVIGIAALIYFGILVLLRGFTREEYGFLKDIVRGVI
ncbi:MAG: Polysaccharide biosynthesis protein [Candidatus Syntrophoarchaeum sp. GoM_oil]|nr:MAG: Polysaccharide biosynthesis protein [Candidatus Syntrophoarchaeum sp. GoM_oil]